MTVVDVDVEDGAPVTALAPGAALPGGLVAWDRLGVGLRCETWLAWSPALWSPVVTKFPRPHQCTHPRARATLRREAAALCGNTHPAVPRLYDDASAADAPYIVMEHVDGVALDDEIDGHGAFTDTETALIAVRMLAGLRSVHERGLVHVDVKPANVMLRDGRAVVIDFGSARRIGAAQPAAKLIGSPGYAAPDLEAGDQISPAMDVYGAGVTLYEALIGDGAFDPDVPAGRRPLVTPPPSAMGELVARMMRVDPARRPSVDEALAVVTRIAEAAGVLLRPGPTPVDPGATHAIRRRVDN